MSSQGRVLGLDLGELRIGLALSDALGMTAQPLGSLKRTVLREDLDYLARLVSEREVIRVVIGLPLLLSGSKGRAAASALLFAEQLGRHIEGIDVAMWDERMTTVEAERVLLQANVRRAKRREVLDTLSAVLILQSYLDSRTAVG